MIIIKFGGSVITDKSKECEFKPAVLRRLLGEIQEFYSEQNENEGSEELSKPVNNGYDLILVHGAGSFGHILAKKYHLDEGFKNNEQTIGLSEVHRDVRDLNLRFMNELLTYGIPGLSLPPMVVLRNDAKNIAHLDSSIFSRVLDMNCVPVTFGDVVPDDTLRFSICSGDSIIEKLTEALIPVKVIFLTDVDGLFTTNPVLDPKAKLIDNLTPESFARAYTAKNVNPDVTGGLYLKAKIALALSKNGVESHIINGTVPGRLKATLFGEQVLGTVAKV